MLWGVWKHSEIRATENCMVPQLPVLFLSLGPKDVDMEYPLALHVPLTWCCVQVCQAVSSTRLPPPTRVLHAHARTEWLVNEL